ncbi:TFCP2 factor, partial [Pseudoatta argentina]
MHFSVILEATATLSELCRPLVTGWEFSLVKDSSGGYASIKSSSVVVNGKWGTRRRVQVAKKARYRAIVFLNRNDNHCDQVSLLSIFIIRVNGDMCHSHNCLRHLLINIFLATDDEKSIVLVMSRDYWNLKSCWSIRRPHYPLDQFVTWLLEHEVVVSGGPPHVQVIAKFVHALSNARMKRGYVMRGGLVSLQIRKRWDTKKLDGCKKVKLIVRLKGHSASPQTRTTIGGNSSPIVAPLALSVSNSGIVPLVPASDAVKENVGTAPALPSPAAILPDQPCIEADVSLTAHKATSPQQLIEFIKTGAPCLTELPPDANATQTTAWLRASRFNAFESTFASFSASDILRLSREDLIQICGVADGIRLFNTLHSKAPTPKLTLYFSLESNGSLWRVAYLDSLTSTALTNKLLNALNLPHDRLHSILFLGPQGIHVLVTDELVANMKDESMYIVETIKDPASERYKLLIKSKII